jgi:hypothetical protein
MPCHIQWPKCTISNGWATHLNRIFNRFSKHRIEPRFKMIVGEPPIQVLKVVIHSFHFHTSTWRLGSTMNPVFNQWNISDNLPPKHGIIGFDQCHVFQTNPNNTIANILIRLVCPRTSHDLSSPSNQNCHIYIYVCVCLESIYICVYIYTRIYGDASLYVPRSKMVHDIGYGRPFHYGESWSSGRADPKHLGRPNSTYPLVMSK